MNIIQSSTFARTFSSGDDRLTKCSHSMIISCHHYLCCILCLLYLLIVSVVHISQSHLSDSPVTHLHCQSVIAAVFFIYDSLFIKFIHAAVLRTPSILPTTPSLLRSTTAQFLHRPVFTVDTTSSASTFHQPPPVSELHEWIILAAARVPCNKLLF